MRGTRGGAAARHPAGLCWIVAILGLASSPGAAAGQVPQQPPIQFETRADLILVDANVIDDKGVPIADLAAADFVVSVDGKPRPVASIQFVRSDAAVAPAPAPRARHYSSNAGTSSGRRILVAVDENSITPGGARAVLASISRFLQGLPASDRVAFVRLPTFEGSVDFTTDRARLSEAVQKVIGKAHRVGFNRVSIAEAVSFERRDAFEWERALGRICSGMTDTDLETCQRDAESEAAEIVTTHLRRARETMNGLGQLIANVRQVPGPKTLVLVSQGFLAYDYRLDILRLAEAASAARVSVYALHIDMPLFDAGGGQPSRTRMEDERLLAEGVDELAGASRGARFRIAGSGEGVFARVTRELSGYYLIGLEPVESDRDGKAHRIKVEVKRAATVRARAQFTMGAAATGAAKPATPADRLLELLRAATPEAGVPLRVTAFATPASAPGRVKLIVGADVGGPTDAPVAAHVGLVLIDGNAKVVDSQLSAVTLTADAGAPAPPRYLGNLEVPEGQYTLRFAVIDPEGRAGSVHHAVDARLKEAGGVSVSDLILTAPTRDRAGVRPEVHLNLDGQALQAMLELTADDPRKIGDTRITFEVSSTTGGTALVKERGTILERDGTVKAAAAILDVGVLPPGEYIARAIVAVPSQKPLTTTRPFEIAPRTAAKPAETDRASTRAVSRGVPRAESRGRMRPPIPPFRKEDVLAPAVVNPFIDHVLASYSPSPAAQAALNAIKSGDMQNATKGERQIGDLGMSFAQGLSLLAADRPAEADAYFRAALRASSDFVGAAFYLGATLAAAGKDRDAVGAWQTALIGEVGAAGVYPVLIDGLLRLREGEQALEFLAEAEPTFTDRDQYTRRLVQAYALVARSDDALPAAHDYLARHPDDVDMLFLTMHMIYEAQASGALSNAESELERFKAYAAKYDAARGPQGAIVEGWRKALGIR